MKNWPITLDNVLAAERRIRPYLPVTPLRHYAALDAAVGLRVLVKHENHQPTCAFKVRNGLAAVTAMTVEERKRGVVAASTGNHGQGVAFAGRAMGVPVTICVPVGANPEKVAAMRGFGASIVEEGKDYDEAVAVMRRLVRERGLVEVHGVNHPMMPAGAGTMTLEIARQAEEMKEDIGAMVVAIGGGSQAVGAMTVWRAMRPSVKVFGVQAAGAATIHDAWRKVRHTSAEQEARPPGNEGMGAKKIAAAFVPTVGGPIRTFAEGLATRSTYELTFDALCTGLTDCVTVSDAEMAVAMRLMIATTHNLAEPAGAAGLAALGKLAGLRDTLAGKAVVIVNCGANVDSATLKRVMSGEM